jgi:hypothetical protein
MGDGDESSDGNYFGDHRVAVSGHILRLSWFWNGVRLGNP